VPVGANRNCREPWCMEAALLLWASVELRLGRVWLKAAVLMRATAGCKWRSCCCSKTVTKGRFTHTMPFPCHATNVPFCKRPLKAMAGSWQGDSMLATCQLSAYSCYHAQFQAVCYQKHTNLRLQWPSGQCETERRL
jgi:hypothetical protein